MSLGRELRALVLSHTPLRYIVAPPEKSVTNSVVCRQRPHTKMIGDIKAISPCVSEERVGKAVPGVAHRVGAEWRGAHGGTLNAAAPVECAALCFRRLIKLCTAGCRVYGGVQLKRRFSLSPQGFLSY